MSLVRGKLGASDLARRFRAPSYDRARCLPVQRLPSAVRSIADPPLVGCARLEATQVIGRRCELGGETEDRCPSCSRKRRCPTVTPHAIVAVYGGKIAAVQCQLCYAGHRPLSAQLGEGFDINN